MMMRAISCFSTPRNMGRKAWSEVQKTQGWGKVTPLAKLEK
jgi:hypothetical protein